MIREVWIPLAGVIAGVLLVFGVLFYFVHNDDDRHSCPSGSERLYAYRYNAALKQSTLTFIGCGITEET